MAIGISELLLILVLVLLLMKPEKMKEFAKKAGEAFRTFREAKEDVEEATVPVKEAVDEAVAPVKEAVDGIKDTVSATDKDSERKEKE